MLPRGQRIARDFFPRHTEPSVSWNGAVLRARLYRSPAAIAPPRFSVVVAKKYAKTAVARNRFKRQTYACIAQELKGLGMLRFSRIVIFPKQPLDQIPLTTLLLDITSLIARARL